MKPEADVTVFSAMLTAMEVEYKTTKMPRSRGLGAAVSTTTGATQSELDELQIRREMEAAVARRLMQRSRTKFLARSLRGRAA